MDKKPTTRRTPRLHHDNTFEDANRFEQTFEPFDVTCVIGTVVPAETGETRTLAAYRLIDEHDAPGTYTFPNQYGGVTTVNIDPNAS